MKKVVLMLLMACIGLVASAQSDQSVMTVQPSNNEFADFLRDIPDVRILNSGSKIVVEYEGEWSEDMKGAFEYAAKIWEENIPMCVPIRIKAKIEDFGGSDQLSSVQCFTYYNRAVNSQLGGEHSFPSTIIKAQTLIDYNRTGYWDTYRGLYDELGDMLTCTDMEISYNSGMIEEFSFNLDAQTESDKYDFVTLAMRNIASGLGLGAGIVANPNEGKILFNDNPCTPFEKKIFDKIGTTDASMAYANATTGSLAVGEGLTLYAPSPYRNGLSLNYTVATGSNPLNYLLAHDFSKGYVMRDIANYNWNWFFNRMLIWDIGPAVGSATGTVDENLDYENTLPYEGTVSLDSFISGSSNRIRTSSEGLPDDSIYNEKARASVNTEDFLRRYALAADSELDDLSTRYVLSVQLKDGSWEPVKSQFADQGAFTIDLNESLPKPESEYARSTTGKLKYRIVQKQMKGNGSLFFGKYTKPEYLAVQYFTREFTPQTPVIAYTGKILEPEVTPYSEQDYYDFVDVKVEISNVEGATQMAVEQMDEGEIVPFTYEVEDFRKGYFIANLDPECSTTLTLIAANRNGLRRSNTIFIPALIDEERNLTFNVRKEQVAISGLGDTETGRGKVSYTITSPISSSNVAEGKIGNDRSVDISTLSTGFYILTIQKNGKIIGSTKFAK